MIWFETCFSMTCKTEFMRTFFPVFYLIDAYNLSLSSVIVRLWARWCHFDEKPHGQATNILAATPIQAFTLSNHCALGPPCGLMTYHICLHEFVWWYIPHHGLGMTLNCTQFWGISSGAQRLGDKCHYPLVTTVLGHPWARCSTYKPPLLGLEHHTTAACGLPLLEKARELNPSKKLGAGVPKAVWQDNATLATPATTLASKQYQHLLFPWVIFHTPCSSYVAPMERKLQRCSIVSWKRKDADNTLHSLSHFLEISQ